MTLRRIAVLTSGGDAPGMNTAIRAVVRGAASRGLEVTGVIGGYDGLIAGDMRPLEPRDVGDTLHQGGTFLQTARCPEMLTERGRSTAIGRLDENDIDALVVIGGDGTLTGALALSESGVSIVGIPASIDNDIWGTNMAIGVDTALNTIVETVDKLRDTASSHQRAFLVETMGRDCGYLALMGGLVCGAEVALIPEVDTTLADVGKAITDAYSRGKNHAFIIVAEGARLDIREVATYLSDNAIGFEPRMTILGHVQRGGRPSAFDRLLASRFGVAAVDALLDGTTGAMTGLSGRSVEMLPLRQVISRSREANPDYLEIMRRLAR